MYYIYLWEKQLKWFLNADAFVSPQKGFVFI